MHQSANNSQTPRSTARTSIDFTGDGVFILRLVSHHKTPFGPYLMDYQYTIKKPFYNMVPITRTLGWSASRRATWIYMWRPMTQICCCFWSRLTHILSPD